MRETYIRVHTISLVGNLVLLLDGQDTGLRRGEEIIQVGQLKSSGECHGRMSSSLSRAKERVSERQSNYSTGMDARWLPEFFPDQPFNSYATDF
jgi:hypothetical protein